MNKTSDSKLLCTCDDLQLAPSSRMCVYRCEHTCMPMCHGGQNREGNVKEYIMNDYDMYNHTYLYVFDKKYFHLSNRKNYNLILEMIETFEGVGFLILHCLCHELSQTAQTLI